MTRPSTDNSAPPASGKAEALRADLRAYFEQIVASDPPELRADRIEWRTYCFDQGMEFAQWIEQFHFPLAGKRALDVACGWGGHALALASLGATVLAADLNDFSHGRLFRFAGQHNLKLAAVLGDCEQMPARDASLDVVLALELVEHIPHPEAFAREVGRVLAPGGIGIISTPAKLRAFIWGEPHFYLRGIAALPLKWQRAVATRWFRRSYPFPIMRQYATAAQVLAPFRKSGLTGRAYVLGRVGRWAARVPGGRRFAEQFLWNFVVVRKPAVLAPQSAGT